MSNELLEAEAEKLPHTRCERNEPYQRSRAAAAAGISPPLPGMSRVKCLAPKKYLYFRSFMERPANKSQVEILGFGSSEKGNTKSSR